MRYALVPLALATSVAFFATAASAQRVDRAKDGSLKVEFPGPCTVRYDRNGRLLYPDRSCSRSQRYAADRAISDYLRYQRPGNGFGFGRGQGQYRITDIRYDRVRFADNCRVYYDYLGRHLRSDGGCNSTQRSYADRAMANWRRQNGYYPGGGGWYPGGQWNDISLLPSYDGGIHVRFRDGCDVYYNRYGNRIRADKKCTRYQRNRADAAARYYRPGYNF